MFGTTSYRYDPEVVPEVALDRSSSMGRLGIGTGWDGVSYSDGRSITSNGPRSPSSM